MTKPTTILILLFISLLFMPTCYAKTCYVNTASSGGDGTTNATTGAQAAYASLSAWEAAEDGIALTEPMTVYCEGTAADTTIVDIAGWTGNSATNTITITTTQANRHIGVWDNSKYRLVVSTTTARVLQASESYVRIVGLQVENSANSSNGDGIGIAPAIDDVRVSHNIVRATAADSDNGIENDGRDSLIYNNIIYDFGDSGFRSLSNNGDGSVYIYNNTIDGTKGGNGIYAYQGTVIAKNNIIQNCSSNDYFGTFDGSSNYNISGDATTTGGANDKASTAVTFANSSDNDFRLSSNDTAAKDAGTDLSADPNLSFSNDIQSQSRPGNGLGSWDIGADEFIAASSIRIEGTTRIGGY